MTKETQEEYFWLIDKLDEINWAIEGQCDDIDCDQYMYKDLLKKKYKPVLEHNFSCLENLKRKKSTILRLLSLRRFRVHRYIKCKVCKTELDKLSDLSTIVSFTRLCKDRKGYSEWRGAWTHSKCSKRFKPPKGWSTF